MITLRSPLFIECIDSVTHTLERIIVVELALHKTDAPGELLPHRLVERSAGVGLHGFLDLGGEVRVTPLTAAETHQCEARRQETPVREVVHGGHDFLAGQVPGDAAEHQG